ncbi:MAG: hypothetical protein H6Q05_1110 [Acidobacteria bacterium]|nr:hypothetical protein [Acidobacteriota bacterium]
MGDREGIWVEETDIRSYDVDISSRLTIESLLKIFQEAAWNHAEHLGLGFSHLGKRNQVWVLSRMMLAVESYPEWGQPVVARTWPRGCKSLLALRDFELLDMQGRKLAGAASGWMIIDLQSRKPQRAEPFIQPIRTFPERRAVGADPEKITPDGEGSRPVILKVKYSDLDLNNHVNNAAYARWILDGYPVDFHRRHRVRRFHLNFLAEVNADDSVAISTREVDPLHRIHTLRRQRDGVESCRAEVIWETDAMLPA